MEQFLLLSKNARGRALCELITRATSEPGVVAFGELLAQPNISELQRGEHVAHYNLLRLFAYGTCEEYKAHASELPALNPQQLVKLQQLSVVTLASQCQEVPYSLLQSQLGISGVRELEDFVITQCMYPGLIRGKLDQRGACVLVSDAIGRDVRPDAVATLNAGLSTWIQRSEALMKGIEDQIRNSAAAAEAGRKQRELVESQVEEAKKSLKTIEMEIRSGDGMMLDDGGSDYVMDDDRVESHHIGGSSRGVDRGERHLQGSSRPKSRRHK